MCDYNIVELNKEEIDIIVGGDLLSNISGYLGLTSGITIGTLATNYCARTAKGILTKISIMLICAFGGTWLGKIYQDKIPN